MKPEVVLAIIAAVRDIVSAIAQVSGPPEHPEIDARIRSELDHLQRNIADLERYRERVSDELDDKAPPSSK
jgi:hypothetical protein